MEGYIVRNKFVRTDEDDREAETEKQPDEESEL
ncbi:hypothetical protein JNEOFJEA_00069 [Aeromonas phage UP87]|nr:hypothetical protein JNEOFJEA_00069 [Aeromonas phage UP87]UYD58529.1 hypothetical protein IPAKJDPM_00186 [Aeromonas phage avDM14-QBC]UYD58744.1 hypothetical protein HNNIDBEH_00151 [Aeromonas phage avDM10-HWA]UYD58952.1 hypothetical protein OFOPOMKI_00102 [Aeromonas phage avDM7-IJDJ]